ncbi:hypothetical protein SAMN05660420_03360 [Desulfuromusa kysingii]|uniref:Uncharacterized protein n=1 Tax=Desulfuromusa kysingii TaxID=37625 RepID=A0A1H4EFR3_9BACT|nr:hypothetical protein [Desulfuromusa kysingii]SEA83796.1 hypothetical protein SAMN05660420_03360 [Desulfuromusa kysingii]
MSIVLTTVLSLLSAITVAVLGHFFSTRRKRTDELAEMRLKAYSDFINSISRITSARRSGRTEDELDELSALNDAKNRICICANREVVEALTEFWRAGGTLEAESEVVAFTRLCYKIRESMGNKRNDIVDLELSKTLFSLEPSTFSFRAKKNG